MHVTLTLITFKEAHLLIIAQSHKNLRGNREGIIIIMNYEMYRWKDTWPLSFGQMS